MNWKPFIKCVLLKNVCYLLIILQIETISINDIGVIIKAEFKRGLGGRLLLVILPPKPLL